MKKFSKKSLSLNKLVISRLNNLKLIRGGSVEGDGGDGGDNTITTTRISQFPMICDPNNMGTLQCETGNALSCECHN